MSKEEIIALLDSYSSGKASKEELLRVEKLKKEDKTFRQTFDEHQQIVEGLRQYRRNQLKELLKTSLNNDQESRHGGGGGKIINKKIVFTTQRQWLVAASVAILVGVIFGFYRYNTYYERLYSLYEPDRLESIEAGTAKETDKRSKYESAFKTYLKGVEISEKGDYSVAIDTLSSILRETEYYYFWAQFEIALVQIKNKDIDKAKLQLRRILNEEGNHIAKDRAKELLEKLDQRRRW